MNLEKLAQELRQLRSNTVSTSVEKTHRFTVVKAADTQAIQRAKRQAEIAKREAREKKFSQPLTFKLGNKF